LQKLNTGKYKEVISEVWIDDRENSRKEYFSNMFSDFNPSIHHLDYGDYIFFGNNGISVCCEFKTGEDFISSIDNNNHLHNQVYDMIHNFDYTFIIIECEDLSKTATKRYYQTGRHMSVQQMNGAISEFNTVSTVLFSQTPFQTADMLMRQCGKIIEQKPFLWKFGKKSHNTALNYLSSIKGLDKQAETIVNTLNLHTKKDLDSLTVEKLMTVDKIGKVKAEMIMSELGV